MYLNMGHNDMDYENKTNNQLSFTFNNEIQNKLIIDGLVWLAGAKTISKNRQKIKTTPSQP